eukprot:403365129
MNQQLKANHQKVYFKHLNLTATSPSFEQLTAYSIKNSQTLFIHAFQELQQTQNDLNFSCLNGQKYENTWEVKIAEELCIFIDDLEAANLEVKSQLFYPTHGLSSLLQITKSSDDDYLDPLNFMSNLKNMTIQVVESLEDQLSIFKYSQTADTDQFSDENLTLTTLKRLLTKFQQKNSVKQAKKCLDKYFEECILEMPSMIKLQVDYEIYQCIVCISLRRMWLYPESDQNQENETIESKTLDQIKELVKQDYKDNQIKQLINQQYLESLFDLQISNSSLGINKAIINDDYIRNEMISTITAYSNQVQEVKDRQEKIQNGKLPFWEKLQCLDQVTYEEQLVDLSASFFKCQQDITQSLTHSYYQDIFQSFDPDTDLQINSTYLIHDNLDFRRVMNHYNREVQKLSTHFDDVSVQVQDDKIWLSNQTEGLISSHLKKMCKKTEKFAEISFYQDISAKDNMDAYLYQKTQTCHLSTSFLDYQSIENDYKLLLPSIPSTYNIHEHQDYQSRNCANQLVVLDSDQLISQVIDSQIQVYVTKQTKRLDTNQHEKNIEADREFIDSIALLQRYFDEDHTILTLINQRFGVKFDKSEISQFLIHEDSSYSLNDLILYEIKILKNQNLQALGNNKPRDALNLIQTDDESQFSYPNTEKDIFDMGELNQSLNFFTNPKKPNKPNQWQEDAIMESVVSSQSQINKDLQKEEDINFQSDHYSYSSFEDGLKTKNQVQQQLKPIFSYPAQHKSNNAHEEQKRPNCKRKLEDIMHESSNTFSNKQENVQKSNYFNQQTKRIKPNYFGSYSLVLQPKLFDDQKQQKQMDFSKQSSESSQDEDNYHISNKSLLMNKLLEQKERTYQQQQQIMQSFRQSPQHSLQGSSLCDLFISNKQKQKDQSESINPKINLRDQYGQNKSNLDFEGLKKFQYKQDHKQGYDYTIMEDFCEDQDTETSFQSTNQIPQFNQRKNLQQQIINPNFMKHLNYNHTHLEEEKFMNNPIKVSSINDFQQQYKTQNQNQRVDFLKQNGQQNQHFQPQFQRNDTMQSLNRQSDSSDSFTLTRYNTFGKIYEPYEEPIQRLAQQTKLQREGRINNVSGKFSNLRPNYFDLMKKGTLHQNRSNSCLSSFTNNNFSTKSLISNNQSNNAFGNFSNYGSIFQNNLQQQRNPEFAYAQNLNQHQSFGLNSNQPNNYHENFGQNQFSDNSDRNGAIQNFKRIMDSFKHHPKRFK